MKKLFLEIIRLCAEAGWVKLGQISPDGTKVKAKAWLSVNRKLKHLKREIDKPKQRPKRLKKTRLSIRISQMMKWRMIYGIATIGQG